MVSSLFPNRYSDSPYADLFFSIALVYYMLTCIFIPNLYPLQKRTSGTLFVMLVTVLLTPRMVPA